MNATEFKAKCLAILDRVRDTGESVLILKHGEPVAQLVPPMPSQSRYPQDDLKGTVIVRGDLIEPVIPADAWEVLKPE